MLAVGFGLAGCSGKTAMIEENQLKLQELVEMNAHQIGDVAQRIEQNQANLERAIGSLNSSAEQLAAQIDTVAEGHAELQRTVAANNVQMKDKVSAIEGRQQQAQKGIADLENSAVTAVADIAALSSKQRELEGLIETNGQALASRIQSMEDYQSAMQNEIRNVQAGAEKIAASLAVLAGSQAKLEEAVQSDRQQTAGRLSRIEDKQQSQQGRIQELSGNVQEVAASVKALSDNLVKLQEVLQNDTRNLAEVIEVIGQGQIESDSRAERAIRELSGAIGAIERNQAAFRNQIEEIRSSTGEMISSLTATLEQLRVSESGSVVEETSKVAKTQASAPSDLKEQN